MAAEDSELETLLRSGNARMILTAILEATPSIAVIVDAHGKVLRISRHACELSGRSAKEIEGIGLADLVAVFEPTDRQGQPLAGDRLPLARALSGETSLGFEGYFVDSRGERVPIVSNAAPILTDDGRVIGAINSVADLRAFRELESELREAAATREMLYHELAHRVINHLQIMSGLLGVEARDADAATQSVAERMSGRLVSLAAVYDRINRAEVGGRIVARAFLEDVVGPYRTETVTVEVAAPADTTLSHEQAGPLGMLLNEAVCNSYKHAFPEGRPGRIDVALRRSGAGRLELEIADDGVGLPPASSGRRSHGTTLMQVLARQLGGELDISERPGGGARILASVRETAA